MASVCRTRWLTGWIRPDAPDLPAELEAVATLDSEGLEAARLTDATLRRAPGAERPDRCVRA